MRERDNTSPHLNAASLPASTGRPSVAAHTPGPWRFRLYATDDALETLEKLGIKPVRMLDNSGGVAISCDAGRIAVVDCQASYKRGQGHATECSERDANARLIAAAPDLLEALKGFRALYLEAKCPTAEYITRTLQAVNAAIAKASPTDGAEPETTKVREE